MRNFNIEKTDSQCIVTWRYFDIASFIACLFLLVVFTVTVMVMLRETALNHNNEDFFLAAIFSLVFCGFWLFFFVSILHMLFSELRLVLDEAGLEAEWTCLFIKSKKQINLADIHLFEKEVSYWRGSAFCKLRVVYQGNNTNYSAPMNENELNDLYNQLNVCLKALKTGRPFTDETMENYRPEPVVFGLDSPPQHPEPPKSRWYYQTDYNGLGFQKQGENMKVEAIYYLKAAVLSFGLATFFAFVSNEHEDRVGRFLFTTAFALLGLWTAFKAVSNYLEPRCITSWMFYSGVAKFRTVRFGWTRSKTYDLYGWKSLVVQIPEAEYKKHHTVELELKLECDADKLSAYYNDSALWQLAFLDTAGEKLMSIDSLSKPEALWMADVVLREQRAIR
jgi:hypothetical protein